MGEQERWESVYVKNRNADKESNLSARSLFLCALQMQRSQNWHSLGAADCVSYYTE